MKYISLSLVFVVGMILTSHAQEDDAVSGKVQLQGVLEPIAEYQLATEEGGVVAELLVSEGDEVEKDQVLVQLKSDVHRALVAAAESELAISIVEAENEVDLVYARISAEVNEKVLERTKQANEQYPNTVSGTELERLKLELERSRLSGEQAMKSQEVKSLTRRLREQQLKVAKLQLQDRVVRSQSPGTVVDVLFKKGEYVPPGKPLVRMVSLNKLRVKCVASAKAVDRNKIGNAASFALIQNGEPMSIPASVSFISPEVDPVRQAFAVWAEIDNSKYNLSCGLVGKLTLKMSDSQVTEKETVK